MVILRQALKSGIVFLSVYQSLALELNIPIHRCDPKRLSLPSSRTCASGIISSLSTNTSSLNTLPIPPAPYHFTVPDSHIGITLTNYGADIPVRQGFGLMTTSLDQWNEITHEGDPALEALKLQRDYVWNNGPVRITLRPKLLPIPDMRWLDVYGLILLLIQFLRRYAGMVEAEMEVVGIFPDGRRPNILLGHATLELIDGVH